MSILQLIQQCLYLRSSAPRPCPWRLVTLRELGDRLETSERWRITITAMGIWAPPFRLTYAAENSHKHHQTLHIHAHRVELEVRRGDDK